MDKIKIIWADDEIDLLKPQLYFLEKKGYHVITVSNGFDAIEEFEQAGDIDIIFLDESMPVRPGPAGRHDAGPQRAGTPSKAQITETLASNCDDHKK